MTTHTIRNKSKPNPIFTLTPKFFSEMQKARPESISFVLGYFSTAYKKLTGKGIHLDHEQELVFSRIFGCDEQGSWKSNYSDLSGDLYYIRYMFEQGVLQQPSLGMEKVLQLTETFYDMLDMMIAKQK